MNSPSRGCASGPRGNLPRALPARRTRLRAGGRPNLSCSNRGRARTLSADVIALFTPLFFAFGLILSDCVRQRRQPAAGARRDTPARDWRSAGDRRVPPAPHRTAADREPAAGAGVRGTRLRHLTARARSIVYGVTTTWAPAIGDIRLAVPPADWRVALFLVAGAIGIDRVLRARAGAAGHAPRTGARDARRSGP